MMRRISLLFLVFALLLSEAAFAQSQKGANGKITLNFVDVEISSLVKIMSELTGRNFLYDETLKGKVTIIAPTRLTQEEALSLFISALELKSFTVVQTGEAYKIIPSSLAKQSGTRVLSDDEKARADEYIVRLIPLEYISTQEAFPVIQPLVSRNGQVSSFGTRNALLVVDTAQNIEKILQILATVDLPPESGEPEVVYLQNAQAETLVQVLRREEQRRTGSRRPTEAEGDSGVAADARLNAVILAGPETERAFFRRFITILDVPPPATSSRINVYYLENADADDLGRVLDSLIRGTTTPAAPQPGGGTAPPALSQELTGKVSITPDKATNSLIIMASPADYQNLVQVIQKLDRRPRQVFVEAMITEVSVDKALELGTKFRIAAEKDGAPVAIGGVGSVDTSTIQSVLTGLAGFTMGGIGNFVTVPVTNSDGTTTNLTAPGFAALFSLSDFKNVVNVLSTPHILTSDNSDAEIVVGENVPFLSKFEAATGTSGEPIIQSIERRDVGIRLKIKPKISEGDFVKLDIYQEISSISTTTVAGASDLITTKRSAKTMVVVKNNQTVVIGGLIQDKTSNSSTKIPLLGDLPLIGWLFKSDSDSNQKTNLLVFITPYIIEDFKGLEDLRNKKDLEFREKSGVEAPKDKKDDEGK